MKTLFSFFVVALLSATVAFGQAPDADDAAYIDGWKLPIAWFPNFVAPVGGVDAISRTQVLVDSIADFDYQGCVFDDVWAGISGAGSTITHNTGNVSSDNGSSDFTGAFKVLYDNTSIYILLKYTDDDVTGMEQVEIMWAPYLKINAPDVKNSSTGADIPSSCYVRYSNFGAYKATFNSTGNSPGFVSAMSVTGSTGVSTLAWGATPADLVNNLDVSDYTAPASHTIRQIYAIPYVALWSDARGDFNTNVWKQISGGMGLSFDMKINDPDSNDPTTADANGKKSGEYFWNSTSNDGYAVTWYSGFLMPRVTTGIEQVKSENSIFGVITTNQIQLKNPANVTVFNSIGKKIMAVENSDKINVSNLGKGVFIIKVNNETKKFVR